MKNAISKYSPSLLLGLFFILYSITSYFVLDPDFGWEIPLGNHILMYGVPPRDLFSYSMPSYPFVDHEWATHAAIAWLHARVGMLGLALLFASIAVTAVYVATRNAPFAWRRIMIILLGMLILQVVSVRPQVISFLFFAIVAQLILSQKLWNKWKWLMPPFFLVWANLHGGFVIGLGAIGLGTLLRIFKEKKYLLQDWGVVLVCAAVTLINPYGPRLWHEVLLSVFDTRLRYTVNEWMPTIVTLEPTIWFFVAVTSAYTIARHKDIDISIKILFGVFLFLGISSYRNISLFAIFAATASAHSYEALRKTTLKSAAFRQRLTLFHTNFFKLLLIGMILHICTLHQMNIRKNSEQENYPKNAITYIEDNAPQGNLLSLYEWGGYLLWKYPGRKVFVDGRMPSWRQNISDKPHESADASWEYLELFHDKKQFGPIIKKFNITDILVRTDMIQSNGKIPDKKKKEIDRLVQQMKANHMKIVYQDNVATLFSRN